MCPPSLSDTINAATSSPTSIQAFVPQDAISQAAYTHAAQHLHPEILNHSLRVFLHTHRLQSQDSELQHPGSIPLLFTASLFHDIGTCSLYNTGPARFEIEGADAAVAFLAKFPEVTTEERRVVWEAIALHSTPQIPERMGGLVRLVRLGVAVDFLRPTDEKAKEVVRDKEWMERVEGKWPRGELWNLLLDIGWIVVWLTLRIGDIEKVLGDAVVEQAMKRSEKAPPACWPGGLYRAKLAEPEWEGVNKAF